MSGEKLTHRLRIPAFILGLLSFFFIPYYFLRQNLSFGLFFGFYAGCLTVLLWSFRKYSLRKFDLRYQSETLQEKINVTADRNQQEAKNTEALKTKIIRYNSLKDIIEEINQRLDLEGVAESLADISFSVIGNKKCTCLLYLVDPATQKLSLFKTKKENKDLVVKEKEGDILDQWVMRHANPLLVEDIRKDFRFDPEKLKAQESHAVASLISAPFVSENRLLGLMRLDSPGVQSFSQEDLRLLVTICDLGAVALENGELFQKTQDLAIHDGLTQLFTKGYFLERLKEECKRSIRQASEFCLLMLDIDHFKDYNDRFGHTAGDLVLQKLSASLTEDLKDFSPVICRFGGEEFCVILNAMDKKKAVQAANKLRETIAQEKIILRRQETHITVSIGVAAFPQDAIEENELILKADKAMYESKQKGRNRVSCA